MKKLEDTIDFLLVGTAKSGTTSVFHAITQHPKIFVPKQKEMNFFNNTVDKTKKGATEKFSKDMVDYISSVKDFKKNYNNATIDQKKGDITPTYLFNYKYTIPLIKKYCSDKVKIIIFLRNPIDRTHSHYLHFIREGWEKETLFDALNMEDERLKSGFSYRYSYKGYSKYFKQVKAFQDNFSNVKIFLFEDLFTNQFFKEFFEFIEVEDFKVSKVIKTNSTGLPKSKFLQRSLNFFRRSRFIVKIFKKMGLGPLYLKIKYANLNKPKIDHSSKSLLSKYFKDDIKNLESLIDRDLSKWLL